MHVHALMHTHTGTCIHISHIHMQQKRRRNGEKKEGEEEEEGVEEKFDY